MTSLDRRRYDMLVRVQQFGIAHAERFPADSLGGRTFAALAATLDQVSGHLTSQAQGYGATRSGTLSKAAARAALRQALDALARTARAMAADVPGLEGRFRVVPTRLNDLELLTAGRAFAGEAAALASPFIAHGLPAGFLAELQAALDAFEGTARDRVAARGARASARAGITATLDAADEAVARLDAIVPNTLRGEPALLAAWRVARHIQRTGTAAAGPAEPAPVPAPAVAAPVTPA